MFGSKKNEEAPDSEYFTIYDTKVGTYREPILAINRHDMLRSLTTMYTDPKAHRDQYVLNAEDFQLFKIGEFSKKTGELTGCKPEHIANLHDIKAAVARSQPHSPPALGIAST